MGLDMQLIRTKKGDNPDLGDEVYTWRKAYAIKLWFENHLSGDISNGKHYLVKLSHLEELKDCCKAIDKSPYLAKKLLPEPDGYYNEKYYEVIEDTYEFLDFFLQYTNNDTNEDLYYSASW